MERKEAPSSPVRRDKVPPYSEEAEKGVLGSIFLDASRVIDLCIEQNIEPISFYVRPHQVLYEVLLEMHREGRPVDVLTVEERLRALSKLDDAGSADYLDRLIDSTPTAAHAEYYVGVVREKHILRKIIDCSRKSIDECYSAVEDADTILNNVEKAVFEINNLKKESTSSWSNLIEAAINDINSIADGRKGMGGIPTGFDNLDHILLGFQPKDMIILAARPSMGKTALALNVTERIALGLGSDRKEHPVAVFSLEMSAESLVMRMLCSKAAVHSQLMRKGLLSSDAHGRLLAKAAELLKAPLYIDDTAGLSALELCSRARRLHRRYGIEFVVVDYLQMMNYPQFARDGRQQEVAAISNAMKGMAKELNVPVLILSQLSRSPEQRAGGAPKLSDLRDSGAIEQDADVVMLLRRPARYPEDPEHNDKRLAIVEIAKHRNGPVGEVRLNFDGEFTRFTDRKEDRNMEREYGIPEEVKEGF